ncbi:MAG: ParB/RepB/Spo0J family partition protein [Eubacteriales bacterium]|nr:ParB/RepB/Spo0J family partition protein [Eubacteriales bacterium]
MNNNTMKKPVAIPVSKLHPFEGHPYKVLDNEEMYTLIDSIQTQGILSPLIVRPLENTTDEYEVVSGHRRLHAAQKAGLETVPALIHAIDRDAAAIAVVDSNLHREHILPSEKAFAYKMKYDAMKHQGKRTDITSGQVGPKLRTDEQIAETADDSARQIKRYIRLTHLIPELLDWMDEGKMALSVGVELAYLDEQLQHDVLNACQHYDCTPSYSQAVRLHRAFRDGDIDTDTIQSIMQEEKANQREMFKVPMDRIRKYFPKSYTAAQIEDAIVKFCEQDYRRRADRER